jgi:hypothetical protein
MYSRTANSAIAWIDLIRNVVVLDSVTDFGASFLPIKKAKIPIITILEIKIA